MSQLFQVMNLLVLPFWLLMIVLPAWSWTVRIMRSPLVIVPNVVIYTVLIGPRVFEVIPAFGSLDSVAELLGTPFGAAVAWAHFLAFDLFVGRWAYLDSRERRIHPMVMAPVLLFTFMLGPIGFLAYLAVCAVMARSLVDQPESVPAG